MTEISRGTTTVLHDLGIEDADELSTKIYTYKDAEDERHATERCKKDMMDDKPRRAKSAKCVCQGKE